jgi:hypothetical protein
VEKNACKRIKDKMERLTQEVDERYRAERERHPHVYIHTLTLGPPNPVEFDSSRDVR